MDDFLFKNRFCLLVLVLVSGLAFASLNLKSTDNPHKRSASKNTPWFVGLSYGPAWPDFSAPGTSVLNGSDYPSPFNTDYYSMDDHDRTDTWALSLGYRIASHKRFFPFYSFALRYQHLNDFKLSGTITQYTLPDFLNYRYSVKTQANIFSLDMKADIYQFHALLPYIDFSLGKSSNTIENYHEAALSGIVPRISPNYQNSESDHLMYRAGFGIDYLINRHVFVSLGYEYSNLGSVTTGNGTATWANSALHLGKLRFQSVMLSLFINLPIH